jgi:hypothetical protein
LGACPVRSTKKAAPEPAQVALLTGRAESAQLLTTDAAEIESDPPQQLTVVWDQRPDRRTRMTLFHLQYPV